MTEEPDSRRQATEKKPFYKRWWFIAIAIVAGRGAIASIGDDEDEDASPDTTLEAADTTPSEATNTTTEASTTSTSEVTTTTSEPTTTTTTTTKTPTTTTTTVPETEAAFSDGTWLVGDEIAPGIYQTDGAVSSCYWERLSGLGGTFDELIANANVDGQGMVEIQDGDVAFSADDCGDWIELTALDEPLTSFGDGTWAVGAHIAPGRYRATGGNSCYWERLSGFSGEFDDLISNDNVESQAIVEINANDAGFHTDDCGTFELVS